ncbi:MAG: diguanylate cyclase, partial [Campylobacterota bacterium]|nr:diguanylate cyclase [Campylobacterota bacterium]
KKSFYSINIFLDSMIFKNIAYDEEKFQILEKIAVFSFIITLLTTLWYRRRLNSIYRDILHLYSIDKNKKEYEIFSQEADAIQLRMNRKPVTTDNPAMLDPVTQINNHKGMMSSYSSKKGMKDSNFTSVTIFEIDNFSKQKRAFSQEFTQAILKKVAFTISLHEQATDVIARTDYNQFTIVLSRASKEQSFKDVDIIRQSISEIKFKAPGGSPITITVSGGFIIKPNNQHLEESLRQAKELLLNAKKKGKNSISQIRDLAENEL